MSDASGYAISLESDSKHDVRMTVLVSRYGTTLQRFLTGLTRRPEVAEDLTQQLWLRLLEAARRGQFLPSDDACMRSYLFAAARNLFLDECVRKHASARTAAHDPQAIDAILAADPLLPSDSVQAELEREQCAAAVTEAIQQLPVAQQAVIRHWMAGVSVESMSAATGAPRDTVLSRKKYAFRHLKAALATAVR